MSDREVPEFSLDDYPVNRAGGRMEVLDAETIYYWEGKYWLAVLTVKSTFGQDERSKTSVRIYRWKWKTPRDATKPRWMRDQIHTINKPSIWSKTLAAVEKQISNL